MDYPTGVKPWKIDRFRNAHENFLQRLKKDASFDLHLPDPAGTNLTAQESYNRCTANLQWLLRTALDEDLRLRAMGSGWSLGKVAVSESAIINTKRYRHKFRLGADNFAPGFLSTHRAENYRFLQCGNTIIDINDYLERDTPAKALRASGGSNGQTIVGGFSTNTHGAAIDFGGLAEMVRGIHLVSAPDRHYYIERETAVVTSPVFHDKIGAVGIRDDELFNAVLVSFGSFGIIHGVLVEVEDRYLLEQRMARIPYDQGLERAITRGDFSPLASHLAYPPDDAGHPIYHFDVAINPHDFAYNDPGKGAYVRVMHKVAYRQDYPRIDLPSRGFTYGDDVLGLMQTVLDRVERTFGWLNQRLIPGMVNRLFDTAYDRPDAAIGTIGETFRNTTYRGKLFSAAVGLDRRDVPAAIECCLRINESTKLAGAVALRFVRGTRATFGITRWRNSCVLELDGVDARVNHRFFEQLLEQLEVRHIPYAIHWGKINALIDARRLDYMYGAATVERWKAQRSRVMSREVQAVFNNAFMEGCGLHTYIPYPAPVA
ncbi:hypothetical protein [Lewinella sp. JB7]|uniref:hypothetical protein n=1 Tax=Lewinella sp. JB7 TaxID=2962887 RepID=UPI0020CA05E9|nr:hypothetical protein [Lewinella sp. JB7]MCP9237696.1 hypothetical protein [Lewinella sp. JB7]